MPHAIRARFTPAPSDYVDATLAFYFSRRSIILLTVISALFILLAVPISLVQWGQGSTLAIFILLIALGYLLIAATTVVTPLLRLRTVASRNQAMQAETTWSIEVDRIEVRNRFEKTELVWGMFDRLVETRKYLLLVYAENKRQFTFLPKQAFLTNEERLAFIQLAREKLA